MKMMRRLLSLFLAICMLMSITVTAFAEDYNVETADELDSAFKAVNNKEGDTAVNVTIKNSIDMGGDALTAREGYTYNVTSSASGNTLSNVVIENNGSKDSTVTIGTEEMNIDVIGTTSDALKVQGNVDVAVNGDLTAEGDDNEGVYVIDGAQVTVDGNITTTGEEAYGIYVSDAIVNVEGDITTKGNYAIGVYAHNSQVNVDGKITAEGSYAYGVEARESVIAVEGGIATTGEGGDGMFADESYVTVEGGISTQGDWAEGIYAEDSDVTITGDITTKGSESNGVESDKANITIIGDITTEGTSSTGVFARNDSEFEITGNITTKGDASVGLKIYDAKATVDGSITTEGDFHFNNYSEYYDYANGLEASGDSQVEITGDILTKGADATGGMIGGSAAVAVGGDVRAEGKTAGGLLVEGNAVVTVNGDVAGADGDPSNVDLSDPEDYADGGTAMFVRDNAQVTVGGDVSGGDAYGTFGYAGSGMSVSDSAKVTVSGNVTGGNVIADPTVEGKRSNAGYAVGMDSTATVSVGGNVTGGSTNGDDGYADSGLIVEYCKGTQGSVTVGGTVSAGSGERGTSGISLYNLEGLSLEEMLGFGITAMGGYDSVGGQELIGRDSPYEENMKALEALINAIVAPRKGEAQPVGEVDRFWPRIAAQLRNLNEGETLTVDAGGRTTVPAYVLKMALDMGVTLVIQWDGGEDITIDSTFQLEEGKAEYTLAELAK